MLRNQKPHYRSHKSPPAVPSDTSEQHISPHVVSFTFYRHLKMFRIHVSSIKTLPPTAVLLISAG